MVDYLATLNFGVGGTTQHEVISADTEEQANEIAYEMCVEHAGSYGFEQNEDYFGDLDSLGSNWDEEEQAYESEGFVDSYVEVYNHEEHEGLVNV